MMLREGLYHIEMKELSSTEPSTFDFAENAGTKVYSLEMNLVTIVAVDRM